MVSFLLQSVGLVAIVTGAFLVSTGVGVMAVGLTCVFVGLAFEDR